MLRPGISINERVDNRPAAVKICMRYCGVRRSMIVIESILFDIDCLKVTDVQRGFESMCSRVAKVALSKMLHINIDHTEETIPNILDLATAPELTQQGRVT